MPSLFCFFVDVLNMCCSAKIGYCNSNVDLNRARNWGGQEVSGEDLQQGFLGWCRRCMFFPKVVNETGVNMLLLS